MATLPVSGQNIPLHVVLDFDGTITEEDTIGVLAEIGMYFVLCISFRILLLFSL